MSRNCQRDARRLRAPIGFVQRARGVRKQLSQGAGRHQIKTTFLKRVAASLIIIIIYFYRYYYHYYHYYYDYHYYYHHDSYYTVRVQYGYRTGPGTPGHADMLTFGHCAT